MALEDKVQAASQELVQRIRQQSEREIRGFVSELLTEAARERGSALDETRRAAENIKAEAVRHEAARVRADVEKVWSAKLREANEAAERRLAEAERLSREESERQMTERVTAVRAEGQRVLEAALEAARREADRTLKEKLLRVNEEAERTLAAELAAVSQAAGLAGPAENDAEVATYGAAASLDRVLSGLRRLDAAPSLMDALDALGDLAGTVAGRAALVTVQDDRVRGWHFVGFDPDLGDARRVELELGAAGIVGRAAVTRQSQSIAVGSDETTGNVAPAFATLEMGDEAAAVPLVVGGQVMAVLYGDDTGDAAAGWRPTLEIFARHTAHCLEALTATRMAQLAQLEQGRLVADPGPKLPFDSSDDDEGLPKPS